MSTRHRTFAIFRIIGNSLPPRHSADHAVRSTLYVLENEEEFEGCEKLWVLNRIADRDHKQSLIDLLREKKRRFIDIPFDANAHFDSFLDVTGAPVALRFALKEQSVLPRIALQLEEWKIRHKSQHLVGINDARNVALKFGRANYDWSVIADGGVVFSRPGWDDFVRGIEREPERRIAIIPMYRVYDWKPLREYRPGETEEEPQIAFHRTSEEVFDPARRYGNQNKAELIARLGLPGPWQKWRPASWEIRQPLPAPNFKNFVIAGCVYRLPANGAGKEERNARFMNRFRGVQALSYSIDHRIAAQRRNPNAELVPRIPAITDDVSRGSIKAFLDSLAGKADRFVTDKTVTAPSGNVHDYYSVAPHYSAAGLKYDGYPHDDARAREAGDAEAFRNAAWKISACAVGGILLGQPDFTQRAASLLKAWFVEPSTKMSPSLRYAQLIPGSDELNDIGIVEVRQLANIVGAIRCLEKHAALEASISRPVKEWFLQFLDDCDRLGIREKALQRSNNIGTWAAVLFGSLDLFCGRFGKSFSIGYRASERLGQQLGPFSVQLHETGRAKPLHYSLFNLAAWFSLLRLCREFEIDLFRFSGVHNESLRTALTFCSENRTRYSDYAGDPANYDAWIGALEAAYHPGKAGKMLLVPTPHWGLPPIVLD